MSDVFTMKQGDTNTLFATLKGVDGTPQPLPVGTVVKFTMVLHDGTVKINKALATIVSSPGRVSYDWAPGETSVAGLHSGEFEVTFVSGKVLTFPNSGPFRILMLPQLA